MRRNIVKAALLFSLLWAVFVAVTFTVGFKLGDEAFQEWLNLKLVAYLTILPITVGLFIYSRRSPRLGPITSKQASSHCPYIWGLVERRGERND